MDLIKKDLEEIQYKGRISFGANKTEFSETKFKIETQQNPFKIENENSSFKKSNFYNLSACDLNVKPVSNNNFTLISSQKTDQLSF